MMLQVVSVLTFPLGHAIAEAGGKGAAYMGAGVMLAVRCIAGMVFICNMLLVTRSAPSPGALGTVNGLAQMVASASRAVGPAVATSLFAYSIKNNVLSGNLVWMVLVLLALSGVVVASRLPPDRPKSNTEVQTIPNTREGSDG
ncbi:hypothetical protein FRC09_015866 [Ceratobasidium sp. 395]|nr:hypothetical protein FRC09_015866 [Ceratobasidium sp. 395]